MSRKSVIVLSAAALAIVPACASGQTAADVTSAEQELATLQAENATRLAAAEAKLKDAKIAKAKKDIADAEAAQARAKEAAAYLATQEPAVSTKAKAEMGGKKAEGDGSAGGGQRDFAGIKFGVGLSLTIDIGSSDRVVEATAVNRIVRATKTDNSKPRIMLESHYFFTPSSKFLGLDHDEWGVGPFVAVRPGSEEVIDAIAFGAMIGLRRGTSSNSFNIGVGLVIDPSVQILGEGIKLNQALPEGEEEVRFRQTSQKGILGLVSFSF